MKKLLLLTGAIIALGGITSCSDDNVASIDPVSTQAEEATPINFGTYLGNGKTTRFGSTELMTTDVLKTTGFGVYAFYTGTDNFVQAYKAAEDPGTGKLPINFMENEKISFQNNEWTCASTKYWPNPTRINATTTQPQYVSFFAYAPYVALNSTDPNFSSQVGITSLDQGGTENYSIGTSKRSDVMVTWTRANGSEKDLNTSKVINGDVDLLWGTAGDNGKPAPIKDDGNNSYDEDKLAKANEGKNFSNATSYNVNADLTKMGISGKVQFKFIHALGAFGGFQKNKDDVSSIGNGILIDCYDDGVESTKGNLHGGDTTRVYVNWIAVEFMSNDATTDNGSSTYNKIPDQGFFDIVTGQWKFDKETDETKGNSNVTANTRSKKIYYFSRTGGNPPASTDKDGYGKYLAKYDEDKIDYDVVNKSLNTDLWQSATNTSTLNDYSWITSADKYPDDAEPGVTTTSHTVYASSDSPIFFIPGSKVSVRVIVNYDIITLQKDLTKGGYKYNYARANQELARDGAVKEIEMNKMYALYIHLGLTSMKLGAEVAFIGTSSYDPNTQATTGDIEDALISPNGD